jgi:hypothetical protein
VKGSESVRQGEDREEEGGLSQSQGEKKVRERKPREPKPKKEKPVREKKIKEKVEKPVREKKVKERVIRSDATMPNFANLLVRVKSSKLVCRSRDICEHVYRDRACGRRKLVLVL